MRRSSRHDEFSSKCCGEWGKSFNRSRIIDLMAVHDDHATDAWGVTGGKAPAAFGVRDQEKNCTPVYRYGWVVSRAELYEAINGETAFRNIYQSQIYFGAGRLLCMRWTEKGSVLDDSDAIIKSMEKKEFHEECRDCMGSPKAMESGMNYLPKELSGTVTASNCD